MNKVENCVRKRRRERFSALLIGKVERVINFASGSFNGQGISARTLRGSLRMEGKEIGNNVVVGIAKGDIFAFGVER